MTSMSKTRNRGVTWRVSACAISTAKQDSCLICYQPNCLYRCPDLQRGRKYFVKQKQICFNCINSSSHNSKKCTSSTRYKVQGYGKRHQTLLHFTGLIGGHVVRVGCEGPYDSLIAYKSQRVFGTVATFKACLLPRSWQEEDLRFFWQ